MTELPNVCESSYYGRTSSYLNDGHFYQCLACNMGTGNIEDGITICALCITKCHANHKVKYVKFGRYGCDCADKGKEPCSALKPKGRLIYFGSQY